MRDFKPECTLPPNGTYSGFVHGPNTRSTLEIVWSCIGIIILSTWSILHLDLPADVVSKNKRQWICKQVYLLWRKVFWMGLKLFSPEFAATGCARKIFATRSNSAMLEQLAHIDGVPWSLKHTILVDMGGIALRFNPSTPTGAEIGTTTPAQNSQRRLSKEEEKLEEKKKSFIWKFGKRQGRILNWCGEIPWYLWKCHVEHARMMEEESQQSQPKPGEKPTFSEADVASLAGNIWILDSKQLAIARRRGIITKMPDIKEEAINDKSKSDGLVKIIAILQVLWLVVQLIVRTIDNLHFTQLEITTVAFAATAVIIYSIDFIKPKDVNVPFYIEIEMAVEYKDFVEIAEAAPFAYIQGKRYYMPTSTLHDLIDYKDSNMIPRKIHSESNGQVENGKEDEYSFKKDPSNKVSKCEICGRWEKFISSKRSDKNRCSWRKPYKLSPKAADIFSLLIGFTSATSFGGVHLFAWNSDFPTDVEKLLWRISALMTIVLPYIYIATHIPYIGSTVTEIRKEMKLPMNIALGCIAICYIPCRLFLVAESFRSLYYLPSEAFQATPGVMNIPHLG